MHWIALLHDGLVSSINHLMQKLSALEFFEHSCNSASVCGELQWISTCNMTWKWFDTKHKFLAETKVVLMSIQTNALLGSTQTNTLQCSFFFNCFSQPSVDMFRSSLKSPALCLCCRKENTFWYFCLYHTTSLFQAQCVNWFLTYSSGTPLLLQSPVSTTPKVGGHFSIHVLA